MLSIILTVSLLYPLANVQAEGANATSVSLGDYLEVSVNDGPKSLMNLYDMGLYEGKVSVIAGLNMYQIFLNGSLFKQGEITAERSEDIYIRYNTRTDKVSNQYELENDFKYPAAWVGEFSKIIKEDGTAYFGFNDWAPSDSNANLDYIGGGCFKKTFQYDAIESDKSMNYKVAFGGNWNHGSVPESDKNLTFPVGSTEITLWANSIKEKTFDSINDGTFTVLLEGSQEYTKAVGTMEMELAVDGSVYTMVETDKGIYMATVLFDQGTYSFQNMIDDQNGGIVGEIVLENRTAVTFRYDAAANLILDSVNGREELRILTILMLLR